jgi:hypothetical protein
MKHSNGNKLKLALGLAAVILATNLPNIARSGESPASDKDSIGEATADEKTFSADIMNAVKDADYAEFQAHGDAGFKTITNAMFKSVCSQISARLKRGYHLVFLGACNKRGDHMTLWKVAYDTGSTEDVLQLDVRSGKVAGALIQ